MPNTKKFLDANGVAYLASLLDNYPDNEILSTVISAIQDALDEKSNTDHTHTPAAIGALPSNTQYVSSFNGQSGAITYTAPVTSVNGQTGAITLNIPAAQVQADWNATSGMGAILNKPTIPVAYDDTALAARVQALENIPWVTYYTGTSEPSNSQGQNGDIYLQTE